MHHRRLICAISATAIGCLSSHASAQQSTSATYDDWVVRCVTQGQPPQKACDMEQIAQMQGKNTPVSRVAVPRPVKGQAVKIVIQLPVNAWLPVGIRVQMNDKDPGLAGTYTYCVPAGCFAEVDLTEDAQKRFRAATEQGRILFKNAAQQDVALPLSFKGFGPAFDALAKS